MKLFIITLLLCSFSLLPAQEPVRFLLDSPELSLTVGAAELQPEKILRIDTMQSKSRWTQLIGIRPGALKPNSNYTLEFEARTDPETLKAAYGETGYLTWASRPGTALNMNRYDVANYTFMPGKEWEFFRVEFVTADTDPRFLLHAFQKYKGELRNLRIVKTGGNAVDSIPLTENFGEEWKNAKIPTGAQEFEVMQPKNPGRLTVNAADFGVFPESPDNTIALTQALLHCRRMKAGRLVLGPGTYRFTGSDPILFESLTDFEFDGGGAILEFCRKPLKQPSIIISNCERINFHDFKVDWSHDRDPVASLAKVTEVGKDHVVFQFVHYKKFPRRDIRIANVTECDENGRFTIPNRLLRPYEFRPGQNKPKTEWIDDSKLKIFGPVAGVNSVPYKPGRHMLVQHYYTGVNAIKIDSNRHFTMHKVDVYACPGIAFFVVGTQKYSVFDHCRVIPKPGDPRRVMSSTADHFHLASSCGYLKIENCEFANGGDDHINIHDNTMLARKSGKHTLMVERAYPARRPHAMDEIELYFADLTPTGFRQKPKSCRAFGVSKMELTFEQELPEVRSGEFGFVLLNRKFDSHNIFIRNNFFHDGRMRGLLIQGNDITIENNRIIDTGYGGLRLTSGYTTTRWAEGVGARNIIIRNNRFEQVNTAGDFILSYERDLLINTVFGSDMSIPSAYPAISDILFEGNSFGDGWGLAGYLSSCDNVVFRNNIFRNIQKAPYELGYRGSFFLNRASHVAFIGNRFEYGSRVPAPQVLYQPATVKAMLIRNNKVILK